MLNTHFDGKNKGLIELSVHDKMLLRSLMKKQVISYDTVPLGVLFLFR